MGNSSSMSHKRNEETSSSFRQSLPTSIIRRMTSSTNDHKDVDVIMNDIMDFLIVLNNRDFTSKRCFKQKYSTQVEHSGEYLSGVLNVVPIKRMSEMTYNYDKPQVKYKINDILNLKTLYIKLHKENEYVKSNDWSFEYRKSQVRELVIIFGLLGAKQVEYKMINSHSSGLNFSTELVAGSIPVESGVTISNQQNTSTEISGNISYQPPEVFPVKSTVYCADGIYYLRRKKDWQEICDRRIFTKATIDNFVYKCHTDVAFSLKVTEKFKRLGISFNVDSEQAKNFTMEFNVTYYSESEIYAAYNDRNDMFENMSNISNNSGRIMRNTKLFNETIDSNINSDSDSDNSYGHHDNYATYITRKKISPKLNMRKVTSERILHNDSKDDCINDNDQVGYHSE